MVSVADSWLIVSTVSSWSMATTSLSACGTVGKHGIPWIFSAVPGKSYPQFFCNSQLKRVSEGICHVLLTSNIILYHWHLFYPHTLRSSSKWLWKQVQAGLESGDLVLSILVGLVTRPIVWLFMHCFIVTVRTHDLDHSCHVSQQCHGPHFCHLQSRFCFRSSCFCMSSISAVSERY